MFWNSGPTGCLGLILLSIGYFVLILFSAEWYMDVNGIRGYETNRIYMPIFFGGGQLISLLLSFVTIMVIRGTFHLLQWKKKN